MIFLKKLTSKLRNKTPFTFVRYGDGEWANIFYDYHTKKENCDGNLYYPQMGEALRRIVLLEPEYYMGIQWGVLDVNYGGLGELVYQFIWDLKIDWVNANILHRASEYGKIKPFFDALFENDIILVGAEYFKVVPHVSHIVIPDINCWNERDKIIDEIYTTLTHRTLGGNGHAVILFMAGMCANYLIDEVYETYGHVHTLIDMGSVIDPYIGRPKRGYHHKIMERNERL